MEMLLNTVRMVDHDQTREHIFGDNNTLEQNIAVGIINPSDFKKLNLTESLHINVSNKNGNVNVAVEQDENIRQGTIIMPVSIWSNQLISVENETIIYKNIIVNVEATRDPITSFSEILNTIKKKT